MLWLPLFIFSKGAPSFRRRGAPVPWHNGTMASPRLTNNHITLEQPETYCLSTFRLHDGSLHQDWLPVPVVMHDDHSTEW